MMRQPLQGNRKKFQLKLIEILGKGFDDKLDHNFAADVEQSRAAYKIDKGEVEYFFMRALLCLPINMNASVFMITVRKVIEFYQNTLLYYLNSIRPKLECLRAIEDVNLDCKHLNRKQFSAFLVHFLMLSDVLDADTVLMFCSELQQRDSRLLSQRTFRMLRNGLRVEAARKRERQAFVSPIQSSESEDEDDNA